MNEHQEIIEIDPTNSLILADHHLIANEIINLDSDDDVQDLTTPHKDKKTNIKLSITKKATPKKLGDCPICWDNLEDNPLASTKCGHVFCMKCIENTLQREKRCPLCRTSLTGKSVYHPLYLPTNK